MSTTQNFNLGSIDLTVNDNVDPTKYFNNYFEKELKISPNVDAAIIAYFETVCDNKEAAKALASAVIYTSQTQRINPMQTLKEFAALPAGQLNSYLVMFLNMQRKGTSYLGITNAPVTNKYVTRAILS
jgi:hypothetical protein